MNRLGPEQPFFGLQALGLAEIGDRGDAYASMEEMAAEYVAAIRTAQPTGPYLLGGMSWGGVLVFEMAQQLAAAGEEVRLLALLDTPSPEQLGKLDALDDAAILVGLARDLGFQKGIEITATAQELRGRPRSEQIARVLGELKSAGLVPDDMSPPWMDRQLQGYRSRLRLVREYRPRVYPGRLTFFRAADIDVETLRHLDEVGFDHSELTLGWHRLSRQPIELHTVPGNHSEILFEPNVRILARRLADCITRGESRHGGTHDEDHSVSVSTL
jgi:thioesterase domain-containing protein